MREAWNVCKYIAELSYQRQLNGSRWIHYVLNRKALSNRVYIR